jgi:hypothetical protein
VRREIEDGMGFAGLVGGRDEYTEGWNDGVMAAVRELLRETGDRHEIEARADMIRQLRRRT